MGEKSRKIQEEIRGQIRNNKKKVYLLTALVSVFLFLTIAFIFKIPGVTMESKLICTLEEHIHTEECTQVNEESVQEEHIHSEACYEKNLRCTIEEHTHIEECTQVEGGCGIEEHVHNEECNESELICTLKEQINLEEGVEVELCAQEEHLHSVECYKLEESSGEDTDNPDVEEVPGEGTEKPEGEEVPGEGTEKPEGEEVPEDGTEKPEGEEVPEDGTEKPEGEEVPEDGTEKPEGEEVPEAGAEKPEGEEVPGDGAEKPEGEEVPGEDVENLDVKEIPEDGKGHVDIKISDEIPEGITINARVVFIGKGEYSNSPYKGQFSYEIKDKDGNSKEAGVADFKELSWDGKDGGYLFKGLAKGDSLKIFNVPAKEIIYGAENIIAAKIMATASNEFYPVIYNPTEEIDIRNLETIELQLSLGEFEEPKLPTKNTFKDIGGKYEVNYILEHYNIFSFEDIEGTHIVGPIIAQNKAYRSAGFDQPEVPIDSIKVADLTKGLSSYVGSIDKIPERDLAKLNASYIFDIGKNPSFRKPTLYVNLKDNMVRKEGDLHYFLTKDGEKYLAPNDSGAASILQNNNFIDFGEARNKFNSYGETLAKAKDNVEVSPDPVTGELEIHVGRNYVIKDASRLRKINLIYPEPYDPLDNPFPVETIISVVDNELLKSGEVFGEYKYPTINGEVHYYFPQILVNGEPFNGAKGVGEGHEFGGSNNIVLNLPYIDTDNGGHRVVKQVETDILGHIIAPKAEFWNYSQQFDGSVHWEGGNINGCAIVDSWHGGKMESHMWPFKPEALPIDISFIKKDIAGNKILPGAEFELIEVQSIKDHRPVVGAKPIKVVSDENGNIKFTGIESYSVYKLTEVKAPDGYHKPDGYWIVEVTGYGSTLKINITSHGNVPSIGDDLVIDNKKIKFTIQKVDQVTNELLSGAIFDLYLADKKGQPTGEPLIKDITTGEDGKVTVESELLEYDTLYVLVETKAPDGYINKGNIPFYIMGTEGLFTDVSNKVAIGSDGLLTVTNAKEGYVLPETGGQGTFMYYIVGGVVFIFIIMLLNKKRLVN